MRTRLDARREDEAAAAVAAAATPAAQAAVLIPLLPGPPHVLEAALAALGCLGSAPLLAALAYDEDLVLYEACVCELPRAAAAVVRAYGDAPEACSGVLQVLESTSHIVFVSACNRGDTAGAVALLDAYGQAGCLPEALAVDGHAALRSAERSSPDLLAQVLAGYGEPGCAAVLAALATRDLFHCEERSLALLLAAHGPPGCLAVLGTLAQPSRYGETLLFEACCSGRVGIVSVIVAALGSPGCQSVRDALFPRNRMILRCPLHRVMNLTINHFDYDTARLPALDATLAVLAAALGEPDNATAVREVGRWLMAPRLDAGLHVRYSPAERLARIPPGSAMARLAVATPQAWALNPNAGRALLSAPVRVSLALTVLLTLRRLPAGVAAPVAAHLRARPWLLFASASVPAALGPQ
jgi:hypothetical protein